MVLGFRTFDFFNPASLVVYVARDLLRWIQNATPLGFQYQNPSFQAYYQQQAAKLLTTYDNIVHLVSQEEAQHGRTVAELTSNALLLLQTYTEKKPYIPSDSHWFRRIPKHKEWLTTGDSQVGVALETGTPLQPEMVSDLMWFEADIEETVARTMETVLERGDLGNAVTLGDDLQRTLNFLGEKLAIHEALHLYRTLRPSVFTHIRNVDINPADSGSNAEQLGLALALVDLYGMGLVSIVLGFSKCLHETTAPSFSHVITDATWHRARTVYTTSLPRAVIEQLEYLCRGLEFEAAIEGRSITPLWYIHQIAALGFVRFLVSSWEALIGELEEVFPKEVEALLVLLCQSS